MRYILPLALLFSLWGFSPLMAEENNQPAGEAGVPVKLDLEGPFKIVVDGAIDLNYVFAESPDSFIVTYKLHLEGFVRNKVDIVKSKGEITTSVKGFLAKWPTGECQLKIAVNEVPFEMLFNQLGEEKILLDIKLADTMLENWESKCKFTNAPRTKFNTKGTPEKWVADALKRIVPSLRDIQLPIDRLHKDTTTLKFNIESYQLPDPPLGSGELQGKGTVQVIPEI